MDQKITKNSESFVTRKPLDSRLREYISYYYFHKKPDGDSTQFIFYPHIKNGLTIYKNSKTTTTTPYNPSTAPCSETDYQFLYSGMEFHAINVEIIPPFDKIGIAFQPLGLNFFVDKPLSSLMQKYGLKFDYFKSCITSILDQVYAEEDHSKKVRLLDEFFLSQFRDFKEQRLIKAIKLLTEDDQKYSVTSLASAIGVTRKTLLRLFRKHLNCSVKDYIHIVQFRKAVEMYQASPKKLPLGEVAHKQDYYDQSDFIKHFKKITGFNPKKFFSDIHHLGREDTFWTFVK